MRRVLPGNYGQAARFPNCRGGENLGEKSSQHSHGSNPSIGGLAHLTSLPSTMVRSIFTAAAEQSHVPMASQAALRG